LTEQGRIDQGIQDKIAALKRQRHAVILAHNYQRAEVQDIADFVGDSFELSQNAAGSQAKVIVFCGVHFMAETASILCPDKQVLLPDINAGCNMADMITAEQLRQKKREYPGACVVCYINTSAEVKAECDACCTSANAVRVVENMPGDEVIFVPDQYLGHFVSTKVKKTMHLWPGFCPTHMLILPEHIRARRQEHPRARVVVHPECTPQVIALADEALGTGAMIRMARSESITEMVVGTEIGIIHRLQQENPGKKFIAASERAVCPNMKLITLESILWCLEDLSPEVRVDTEVARGARRAVDRMLQIGG
jgi:quinolinate synthase